MLSPGRAYPLGAQVDALGVNFAIAVPIATSVELCLFDARGQFLRSLKFSACSHGVWHGHLATQAGGVVGLVYGYRVHGPWAPASGHRCNPAKLLLDPYAREVVGVYDGSDIHGGHRVNAPDERDERDNAATALKAVVCAPMPPLRVPAPHIAPGERVLYELHVKAQTALHPQVPDELRGTFAGLAHPAVLDHIQSLGVTTLSLMPVQQRVDEARLQSLGLTNHWGYNTVAWFAPEAGFWSGRVGTSPASEFRELVEAVHARGMEIVLDMVFNHSAETDENGPTFHLRGMDNALYYQLHPDEAALYENWSGCGNCLNLNQPFTLQLVMDCLRYWGGELGVDGFRFDLAPILARGDGADRGFAARSAFFTTLHQDPVCASKLLIAEPWDLATYQLGAFPPGWLEWNDVFRDTQRRYWLSGQATRGELAHALAASSAQFHHNQRRPSASVNFITAHDGFTLQDLVSYEKRHNLANGEHNRDGHGENHSHNCGVEGASDDPAVLALRSERQKALLTCLLLSQGTPMLLAGDEIGHSQGGNNNAYCQDNPTTWLDWTHADLELIDHVRALAAQRRAITALQTDAWWGEEVRWSGGADLPLDDALWQQTGPLQLHWPDGRSLHLDAQVPSAVLLTPQMDD